MMRISAVRFGVCFDKNNKKIFVHSESRRVSRYDYCILTGALRPLGSGIILFPSTMQHDAFASLYRAINIGHRDGDRSLDFARCEVHGATVISSESVLA